MNSHTLSVLVENKPGVLTRVSALFSRRGYNIESLAVGPTESPELSRMTVVVAAEDHVLEQMIKQLNKLIEVIKVVELDSSAIRRELVLIKVRAEAHSRSDVLDVINLFRAKAVDTTNDAIVIEATGSRQKLDALMEMLEPFGVRELAQSGLVAMGRGSRAINDRHSRAVERSARVTRIV